ncbi:MAG TPA: peptidoglycan-binding domain-containing protein [Pyrinomonadaceae bacterium]|nr:peptidoglycan-binding domain-containing protein [Pyrinomonadaceae bacterium]
MPKVVISKSVGLKGVNDSGDVLKIKKRLIELGFNWLTADDKVGPDTVSAIKLFQGIKNGFDVVVNVKNDGLVNVGGDTHRWLEAKNAPRWIKMPAGSKAEGYVNDEVADTSDNHDFGTNWLAETLRDAGADYRDGFHNANPKAALLRVNDASRPRGGDTPMHAGHETGLVCDIRLPRKDGGVGGITVSDAAYDRNTMRAIIKAFRKQKLADRVLLNDPVLIGEGLCRSAAGHHNHAHFEIHPPERIDG